MHCYLIGNRRIYCGETILALVSHKKKKNNHKQKKTGMQFSNKQKNFPKFHSILPLAHNILFSFCPTKTIKKSNLKNLLVSFYLQRRRIRKSIWTQQRLFCDWCWVFRCSCTEQIFRWGGSHRRPTTDPPPYCHPL